MNDSNSFYGQLDRFNASLRSGSSAAPQRVDGHGGGGGGPSRLQPPASAPAVASAVDGPASDPSDYLESGSTYCDGTTDEPQFEVCKVGCRSRFCPHCCMGLGLSLKERLIPVLKTFTGLQMWTFTIDPRLFADPAAAYAYVREHRCIAKLMRELRRRKVVHSGRYFVVVEWQMGKRDQPGTLMAHWHLLADASFIAHDLVCDLWNRNRPSWASPPVGDRPGFGAVRFSAPKFESPEHAAHYACKYLTKYPEKGYPDWVMDSAARPHRFSTSRGFWGESPSSPPDADSDGGGNTDVEGEDKPPAPLPTIRERLGRCGVESVILHVAEAIDPATGECVKVRSFVRKLRASVVEVAAFLGNAEPPKRLQIVRRHVVALCRRFINPPAVGGVDAS